MTTNMETDSFTTKGMFCEECGAPLLGENKCPKCEHINAVWRPVERGSNGDQWRLHWTGPSIEKASAFAGYTKEGVIALPHGQRAIFRVGEKRWPHTATRGSDRVDGVVIRFVSVTCEMDREPSYRSVLNLDLDTAQVVIENLNGRGSVRASKWEVFLKEYPYTSDPREKADADEVVDKPTTQELTLELIERIDKVIDQHVLRIEQIELALKDYRAARASLAALIRPFDFIDGEE